MDYSEFIKSKEFQQVNAGFDADLSGRNGFDYQLPIVKWALKKGKAAIFADTGLGKTWMQLTWADEVSQYTNKPVLVLAPLAVSIQTIGEGEKFGIKVVKAPESKQGDLIHITNYEQLHKYNPDDYSGIVLDESSILKGLQGKVRKQITEFAQNIPYRLSCTATPSPNDFMELGTQAEFLGIMSQTEMLAMFFVNDMSDTGKWRLMKHGSSKFFEWLATWSIFIRSPSDLGFDGSSHELPELVFHDHVIETKPTDSLFVEPAMGLQDRNKARKESVDDRVAKAAEIANSIDSNVLVWCNLNDESEKLTASIDGAVEVTGSTKPELKAERLISFSKDEVKCLVSKPKIAGFGMNWQNCNHMVFVGLSDSFEAFYQAVRRCWRFGQKKTVHVHIISADTEGAVVENIRRKQLQHDDLSAKMLTHMKTVMDKEIFQTATEKTQYNATIEMEIPEWLK